MNKACGILLSVVLCLIAGDGTAQSFEHLHLLGNASGTALGISMAPSGVVRTYQGHPYKWDEIGHSWSQLRDPFLGDSLTASTAMLPSGEIFDRISDGRITQSNDGGASFSILPSKSDAFVVSPIGELFYQSGNNLIRSSDNALTWDTIARPKPGYRALCFDKDGDVLLVGKGTYRLRRGSSTFDSVNDLALSITNFTSSDTYAQLGLYLSCSWGAKCVMIGCKSLDSLYCTSNSGITWTALNPIMNRAGNRITSICCDSSQRIFATTNLGYFVRSDDTGHSWLVLDSSIGFTSIQCQGPSTIWGITKGRVSQYLNSKKLFVACDSPFEVSSLNVWSVAAKNDTIYAEAQGLGLFYSFTRGDSLTRVDNDSIQAHLESTISLSPDGLVYHWDPNGFLFKSHDGVQWTNITPADYLPNTQTLIIDSSGNLILYFYRSSDNGRSWQILPLTSPSPTAITDRGDLCSVYDNLFYLTSFKESTWHVIHIQDSFARFSPTVHASPGNTWLSYDSVLLRSSDGGITWNRSMNGLKQSPGRRIITDPLGRTYCVQGYCSIYVWDRLSDTWHQLTTDSNWYFTTIALAATEKYLFLGTYSGLFRVRISDFHLDVPNTDVTSNESATAFPNPTTSGFSIRMDVLGNSHVFVALYDLLGHIVRTLDLGMHKKGLNTFLVDSKLSSGIYTYQVTAGEQRTRGRIVISN